MKLALKGIEDAGNIERERVVLQANSNTDIGDFAVFVTRKSHRGKPLSGNIPYVYWLPSKEVKTGDLVIIYSKNGTKREKVSESGRTSYFYYWGFDESKWGENTLPVLVETSMWKAVDIKT